MSEVVNVNQLKTIVDRIERLESEKADVSEAIKDIYAEAKGNGYDTKALRQTIRQRKLSREERERQEALLDTYLGALE